KIALDFVPIGMDPSSGSEWREVEKENRLREGAIMGARWFKELERRKPRQSVAAMHSTVKGSRQANRIIDKGLSIKYRLALARRIKIQPNTCYNGQEIHADHITSNCPNALTCTICRGEEHDHRTCCNDDPYQYYCKNCKTKCDHGPGSKDCLML
ncbi:hypothetical protein BJ165DRAFT_1341119, partial [Panaeolus papilionaceus]